MKLEIRIVDGASGQRERKKKSDGWRFLSRHREDHLWPAAKPGVEATIAPPIYLVPFGAASAVLRGRRR
jgi:hypothetical protein